MTKRLDELLQHGHGRGALRAAPGDAGLVFACVARDRRLDWQSEERAVYLARLIRDLGLPVGPVAKVLRTADLPGAGAYRDTADDHRTFCLALDVLAALGRGGQSRDAVRELRDFVHNGGRWVEALEAIAAAWPRELWDDLADVARARADELGPGDVFGDVSPWSAWVGDHPWAAELLRELASADPPDPHFPDPGRTPPPIPDLAPAPDEPPEAHTRRLREAWYTTPHSPSRLTILRTLTASRSGGELPPWLRGMLHEALWDCESDVRMLAVRLADPADPRTAARLAELAADPVEEEFVRRAAARA